MTETKRKAKRLLDDKIIEFIDDFEILHDDIIRTEIIGLADVREEMVDAAWDALSRVLVDD